MTILDITPRPAELVNAEIKSPHVLASICPSGGLAISAGRLPEGCITLTIYVSDDDYRSEITSAIVTAVSVVNKKFGIA